MCIILNPIPNVNPKISIPINTPIFPKSTTICPINVGVIVTSVLHAINFPTIILGPKSLPGMELINIWPCVRPKFPPMKSSKFNTCRVKSALDCNVYIGLVEDVMVISPNERKYPIPIIAPIPISAPTITSQIEMIFP